MQSIGMNPSQEVMNDIVGEIERQGLNGSFDFPMFIMYLA